MIEIPCITDTSHWGGKTLKVSEPPPGTWIVPRPQPLSLDDPTPDLSSLEVDTYHLHKFGSTYSNFPGGRHWYWVYVLEGIPLDRIAQRAIVDALQVAAT